MLTKCRWIIVANDLYEFNVSFFRRTWALLLFLLKCQSAAVLTSTCLSSHKDKEKKQIMNITVKLKRIFFLSHSLFFILSVRTCWRHLKRFRGNSGRFALWPDDKKITSKDSTEEMKHRTVILMFTKSTFFFLIQLLGEKNLLNWNRFVS